MTPIAPLITGFLRQHMPIEQGCSPHTCETQGHAFRLLFVFASQRLGIKPSLPAAMASIAIRACQWSGTERKTASTSLRAVYSTTVEWVSGTSRSFLGIDSCRQGRPMPFDPSLRRVVERAPDRSVYKGDGTNHPSVRRRS
jgi:hypothetical protein